MAKGGVPLELVLQLPIVLVEFVLLVGTNFAQQIVDLLDLELDLVDDRQSDEQEREVEQQVADEYQLLLALYFGGEAHH